MLVKAQTAQPLDTVYLMSGKTVAGIVKDTTGDAVKILIPGKNNAYKADHIDNELVFSIKYQNGSEQVLYKQDTLFGNYFTPQEVRYFMQGERDAFNRYKCPLWTASAFAVGFVSGFGIPPTMMFLPSFAYSGLTVAFRVKIQPRTVTNPDYLKFDTYLMGYDKEARKRRMFRTLAAGGIGIVAGFATSVIIGK
ncbi:MAG: hypothetical protein Fur0041_01320 [Bacteroidia bacterium]